MKINSLNNLEKVESESDSRSVVSDSLWPHGLHSPWNSSGQNTGVSSLSLLQRIFPTQGSNPGLLHCQANSLPTETQGRPKNTRVGSPPFSSRSSWPRNQTEVSCIAGGFFTNRVIREALKTLEDSYFPISKSIETSQNGTSIKTDIQVNKIENPKLYLHIYSQLTFDKGARTIQWRKNCLFNKQC